MKKTSLFLAILLALALFTLSAVAAEKVVFVNGTVSASGDGTTAATAFKTMNEAVNAVKSGGTIVVTGNVTYSAATILPTHTGKILITSKYDGVDYGASIILKARIIMGGEMEFDNINIENNGATQRYILARNYPLTMGEGVTTSSTSGGMMYPIIAGGRWDTAGSGNNVLTIKAGTWHSIIGGNIKAKHTGNSEINFLGGEVLYAVSGGSQLGSFEGNTTVNIGGEAVVALNTEAGVIGANIGDGTNAYAYVGDIAINVFGNAKVYSNIFGVSRKNNVTVNGDITIDIYGNAEVHRNVYGGGWLGNLTTGKNGVVLKIRENATLPNPADLTMIYVCAGPQQGTVTGNLTTVLSDDAYVSGTLAGAGYSGTVNGNSHVEMTGGDVGRNLTAGSAIGTVNGNATVLAGGGIVGSLHYAANDIRGNGGYTNETVKGTVTGTSNIVLDGTTVTGEITLGGATGTITLKSGEAGTVAESASVDLSAGGTLTVGGTLHASEFVGGGTVVVSNAGGIVADTMRGETTLKIHGTPLTATYITVKDVNSNATVLYTATEDETLTKTVNTDSITYSVAYANQYETTKVRVYYYNPNGEDEQQPKLVMYKGLSNSANKEKLTPTFGKEGGKAYAEADLAPGVYYYKVYHGDGGSDYHIKYFYVSGKVESLTYDQPYEPYVENSYMEPLTSTTTDEVLQNFLSVDLIDGYTPLDTPTFTKHTLADRSYMSNAELCDYVDGLSEKCAYLHVYYPLAKSAMGNRYPILVFTKDDIPADATFDAVGEIVRGGGVREILMVSGGVHGNEPAGIEATLAFANAMAGEYGAEMLDAFGAVVIIPSVSVDNFQRFKRNNTDGINPQRDLLQLTGEATQNQVYVYKTFMPTVYIDCHTDTGSLTVSEEDYSVSYSAKNSISHLDDAVIRYASVFNSPIIDLNGIIDGTAPVSEQIGMQINVAAIEALEAQGLRAGFYYIPNAKPNTSWVYAQARGSYGFLIESMRIWSGKDRYERCVYSIMQAIKAIAEEVASYDGALAQNVHDGRENAAVTTFSEDNLFAKKTTVSGQLQYTVEHLSIYLDGTVKGSDTVVMTHHDTVSDFVAMATAYVLDADAENIDIILRNLDIHGIAYTKIRNGAELTLRKYSGLSTVNGASEKVVIGEAETVRFANGAYVVTLDNADAYLITYLFEPDSFPYTTASDHMHSFVNMGYITDADNLYRSEVSNVAELVANLVSVAGDHNGDGKTDILDVLQALQDVADGVSDITLLDVIRILRYAVQ